MAELNRDLERLRHTHTIIAHKRNGLVVLYTAEELYPESETKNAGDQGLLAHPFLEDNPAFSAMNDSRLAVSAGDNLAVTDSEIVEQLTESPQHQHSLGQKKSATPTKAPAPTPTR